jgi:hypothetical protein
MRGHFARNRAVFILSFFFLIGAGLLIRGQFKPSEIAQREQWEEFLTTADIVKVEDIGEGVTAPWKVYLKKGDLEKKAAFKYVRGMLYGYEEGWQYEIAAYRMDKLLGLDMIPPTVEREVKRENSDVRKGALSLWAESKISLLNLMEQGGTPPPSTDPAKYLTRAFDSLIANDDRTQQNALYTEDWRMILIDHSRSFRSDGKFAKKLMYGAHSIKKFQDGGLILFRRLPRAFIEKVKALDFATIKNAMGPYLTEKEIKAVLARKKLLLDEIAEMIKESGEDKVLY